MKVWNLFGTLGSFRFSSSANAEDKKYGLKVDVWALGICLHCMVPLPHRESYSAIGNHAL